MCGTAGKLFFDSGRAVDVELVRRMIDPNSASPAGR